MARAREFRTPILILHATVEANYYEGGGHNTFFTNSTQSEDELKKMVGFLRKYLGT